MRHVKKRMLLTLLGVMIAAGVTAAPPEEKALPTNAETSIDAMREAVMTVLNERDAVLRELNTRYAAAAPEERVALEAESAQLNKHYEELYLTNLIEYLRLTGSTDELERAERMLSALQTEAQPRQELPLERDLTVDAPVVEQPQEGVASDER